MIQNGAKQCSEDQAEIEENVKVTDNIVEEFWFRRHQEARRWVWLCSLSNLLYQVIALRKPRNENHFWVNVYYTACTLVTLTLTLVSYKSKKLSVLVLPAMLLMQIRNSIRFLDLEDTKYLPTNDAESTKMSLFEWGSVVMV